MTDDDVFALLAGADPAPDPAVLLTADDASDPSVALRLIIEGSAPMRTIQPDITAPTTDATPSNGPRPGRGWIVAVAAAVVVVLGLLALALSRTDEDEQEPVDEPAPATTNAPTDQSTDGAEAAAPVRFGPNAEDEALTAVEAFYTAVLDGDIETVMDMTTPRANLEADRRMWGLNAVIAEQGLAELGACEVLSASPAIIEVGCAATMVDPVFVELGVTELVWPGRYFPDGTVQWLPFRSADGGLADFSATNRARAEYLREFRPEAYDAACSPDAYETGTFVQSEGLVLSPECASVFVPLNDEIVQWIRATGFGS